MAKRNIESVIDLTRSVVNNTKVIDSAQSTVLEQDQVEKAIAQGRVAAPPIFIAGATDQRAALIEKLDRENPEYVHSYQRQDVTDWELTSHNQEVVRDSEGRVLHHITDPVVRTPRSVWDMARKEESQRAREAVETRVRNDRSTVYASPKQQRDGDMPKKKSVGNSDSERE